MKLTLPMPDGSKILDTYGIEISGNAIWLKERMKLNRRFLFKLTNLFLTMLFIN